MQRCDARCRSTRGGGQDYPLLRTGKQPGHRPRWRLHLPNPDKRCAGRHRHRQHPMGRRHPQVGDHHRINRLRRGRQAHFGRAVREARRRTRGRGTLLFRCDRLPLAAREVGCIRSRRHSHRSSIRIRGWRHHQAGSGRLDTKARYTPKPFLWERPHWKSRATRRPA